MTNKSDPLKVLLTLNEKLGLDLDENLIKECYQIQKDHQYDRDKNTLTKTSAIVEAFVLEWQGNNFI